jgi:hypothetical protein
VSKRGWIALSIAGVIALGAATAATIALVALSRAQDELHELRGSFEEVRAEAEGAAAEVDEASQQAAHAADAAEVARRVADNATALANDVDVRISLLEGLAPAALTLSDVEDALRSGRILVPAGSVEVPLFCSGEFAVWAFFGLGC